MAYSKIRLLVDVSDNADYELPKQHSSSLAADTVTKWRLNDICTAATAPGTTYEMGLLSTCLWLVVENLHATGTLTVVYATAAGAATIVVQPGRFAVLTDVNPATDLTLTGSVALTASVSISYGGT